MQSQVQPKGVPPPPPGVKRKKTRTWVAVGGVVGVLVLVLVVGWLWRSGRLLGGVTGRVASIVRQVKEEEFSNSGRMNQLRYSLPGPLAGLVDRLFPQNWQGEYFHREALVKIGTNAIPILIHVLETDRSLAARRVCAGALADLDARAAIPVMTRLLRADRDPEVRTVMAEVLGELSDTNAVPVLIEAMKGDAFPPVRAASARALGEMRARWATPEVIESLGIETNRTAKAGMLGALRVFADLRSVPVLVENLNLSEGEPESEPENDFSGAAGYGRTSPYELRVSAAEALGAVGGQMAVDALMARLKDEAHPQLGEAIWRALGETRESRAVPVLLAQLEGRGGFKEQAIEGLGKIGDAAAVPQLLTVLDDGDEDLRQKAVEALGRIGSVAACARLRELIKDDPAEEVRAASCAALALIGDVEGGDEIGRALPRLKGNRENAIWALGHLGGTNAVPVLVEYLDDASMQNRFAAAYALAEIGGSEAASALRARLKDKEETSQHGKACALALLGDAGGLSTVREGLRAEAKWQRFGSAIALAKAGGVDLSEELKPLLADRYASVRTLGEGLIEGQTTATLQTLLQGEDPTFRHYAARSFAFFRDPAALPALRRACGDRDQDVREAARLSLMRIERESAATP